MQMTNQLKKLYICNFEDRSKRQDQTRHMAHIHAGTMKALALFFQDTMLTRQTKQNNTKPPKPAGGAGRLQHEPLNILYISTKISSH